MVKNNFLKKQLERAPIKSGFTLLEILVTISIITLILSLGIVSYNQVFITSRDSARKSDLQVISNALEQYKSITDHYPTKLNKISKYLNPIPKDPKTKNDYIYIVSPANCLETLEYPCLSYNLTTTLEKDTEIYTVNPYGKE